MTGETLYVTGGLR